jgi:hypothetical protein
MQDEAEFVLVRFGKAEEVGALEKPVGEVKVVPLPILGGLPPGGERRYSRRP